MPPQPFTPPTAPPVHNHRRRPYPPLYMPFTAPSPTPRDQQLPLNRLLPERPTNCPPLHEPPSDLGPTSGSTMELPPNSDAPETPQVQNKEDSTPQAGSAADEIRNTALASPLQRAFPAHYFSMTHQQKKNWRRKHP